MSNLSVSDSGPPDNVAALYRVLENHIALIQKDQTFLLRGVFGSIREACAPMATTALKLETVLIANCCEARLEGVDAMRLARSRHTEHYFLHLGVCMLLLSHVEHCGRCRRLRDQHAQLNVLAAPPPRA